MPALALLGMFLAAPGTGAYEHHALPVQFEDYESGVVAEHRERDRPYFLLFSAQWCHWCHVLAQTTLNDETVYTYLNEHFTNVFIDADIHSSVYVSYEARGVPFTVFLNPDGSVYYKYSGTLYAQDFLEVIQEVKSKAGPGKSAFEEESGRAYVPAKTLSEGDLQMLLDGFRQGILEGFDEQQHGLGSGQKTILPRAFLYLMSSSSGEDRARAVRSIEKTLRKAIARIYDPIEGGFFRYAETRDWRIPHYEKMADLNAGAVLLLYRVNQASPSSRLKETADQILRYLSATLFDARLGTFLSFQEADTHYYQLNRDQRTVHGQPHVIRRVFTDRLAVTLDYLLQTLDFAPDDTLKRKLVASLDFLAAMFRTQGDVYHYYSTEEARWEGAGDLRDRALLGILFSRAAARLHDRSYQALASKIVRSTIEGYFDRAKGVFTDPLLPRGGDAEYLMETNGLLAQALMTLDEGSSPEYAEIVRSLATYFSAMHGALEDRLWDPQDWAFTERYVPYLRAMDAYLARRNQASR